MKIDVVRGIEAFGLLTDADFLAEWSQLYLRCPWASVFQGSEFCTTWYRIYRERFEPLLLLSRDEFGRLHGLLPLGISTEDHEIVVAGAWQAQYQCWICAPEAAESFPWHAVQSLHSLMRRAVLTFRFLPPNVPLSWIATAEATQICKFQRHGRPLLRFGDGQEITSSLKKKSNKSRLSRLEKLGPAEFTRVTDPEDFGKFLDDISCWYDFRQAALHESAPFVADRYKRAFHVALLEKPGVMHATVLKFGAQAVAAHLGACGNKEVHLGIIAHSPFLSRHSPGKFHILFLAQMMMQEGYTQLDLTPGGDYKDRFANAFDEVCTLTIFPSSIRRWKDDFREGFEEQLKSTLKRVHVKPSHIRTLVDKIRRIDTVPTPAGLVRNASAWVRQRREVRNYSYDAKSASELVGCESVHRDSLQDLLLYRPAGASLSRDNFLSASLNRIEEGCHVYTCIEDGRLVHWGWLQDRPGASSATELHQGPAYPPDSAVLFGFCTLPAARGRGYFTRCLHAMLRDAGRIPETKSVFISVSADNLPARHVIEKLGFRYENSLSENVSFGRARRRGNFPEQVIRKNSGDQDSQPRAVSSSFHGKTI